MGIRESRPRPTSSDLPHAELPFLNSSAAVLTNVRRRGIHTALAAPWGTPSYPIGRSPRKGPSPDGVQHEVEGVGRGVPG